MTLYYIIQNNNNKHILINHLNDSHENNPTKKDPAGCARHGIPFRMSGGMGSAGDWQEG